MRHALLAAAFGSLLAMPAASILAPPLRILATVPAQEPAALPSVPAAPEAGPPTAPASTEVPVPAVPRSSRLPLTGIWLAAWTAGVAFSLLPVVLGLRQIRGLRRSAVAWPRGRAIAAKLARAAGILRPVEVLLHEALPGPMTCGVLHPAIVLSADAPSWSDEDLHRGMLHELEHVGRGDRVSQCLARSVCALYWFHPLVWIAWRQLALEAERACDDAVLGRSEATAYAAQLVTVARRLSVAKSPLLAMANRVDLTVRVGALLDDRQRRGRAGRLAVALACAAAAALVLTLSPLRVVAAPQSSPVKAAATPEFEVVSVKLIAANVQGEHSSDHSDAGRISMTGSMHRFIIRAYGINSGQLGGEPDWFKTNLYAIDAVTAAPAGPDQMNLMLRGVLANRFQLKLRQEDRDLPVYVLEVAPGGPKFKELKPGEDPRDPKEPPGVFARTFTTMQELMNSLNGAFGGRLSLDRPVIDHTSLTGEYNMLLRTAIDVQNDVQGRRVVQFPDLFHDVQAELGLKLVPSHAKMPYFAVEHAAPPTAN